MVGRLELIACGVLVDDAETAGELQLFVDVPLQIEVVRNGGIARLVERVQRSVIDGVVVSSRLTGVVHVAIALDEVSVHVVESAIRIHLVVLVEGSPRRVVTVVIVYGELVAELQVLHTVGQRDATGEVVAVGAFHRTTYSIIHQVHTILHGLVATLQIERVLVAEAVANGLCQPVGIHTSEYLAQAIGIVLVESHLRNGIVARVQTSQALHLELLGGIGQVVARQVGNLQTHRTSIGHTHAAALGTLRLDDNHTVGSLRTVDGLGRGILQRGDTLHLVHVEVENLRQLSLEAIEDEQRLVGTRRIFALHTGNRRCTSHLEVGQCVRV